MIRLLLPVFLFAALVWWIYGTELQARYAGSLGAARWIGWAILALELVVFGAALSSFPALRTPLGIVASAAGLASIHYFAARRVGQYLRWRGWYRPAPPRGRIIDVAPSEPLPPPGRIASLVARHYYIALLVAYVLVIGLILVIHHIRTT